MKAVHLSVNSKDINKKGFDLSRAGTRGGDQWGKGVYFFNRRWEQAFYSNLLSTDKGIVADIDTRGFLKVKFDGTNKMNKMYDVASQFLTEEERKQYNKLKKTSNSPIPRRDAFNSIVQKNYDGLIIEQNSNGFDVLSGGNQIVVYNTDRISNIQPYQIDDKKVNFLKNEDLELSSRGMGGTSTSNT